MRKTHEVDRVKVDDSTYRVNCAQCGKVFESSRYDASFCSSTCRSKHTRQQQNRAKEIERLKTHLEKVLQAMPNRGESPEFDALNWVIRRVSKAINWVEKK